MRGSYRTLAFALSLLAVLSLGGGSFAASSDDCAVPHTVHLAGLHQTQEAQLRKAAQTATETDHSNKLCCSAFCHSSVGSLVARNGIGLRAEILAALPIIDETAAGRTLSPETGPPKTLT
jgi:hypothetical protein